MFATATPDKASTYLVLFFAEMLSWAGVPALGTAAMGAAGLLAQQGVVHLWAVFVVGTIGAEIGSFGGWWIGRHIARAGVDGTGRLAVRRRQALASGERFAQKWGRFMVFFVPSWVSGAAGTPFRVFAVWNLLACALWTLGAVLGAYGLGAAIDGDGLLNALLPLLIAFAALVAIFLLLRRRARRAPVPA